MFLMPVFPENLRRGSLDIPSWALGWNIPSIKKWNAKLSLLNPNTAAKLNIKGAQNIDNGQIDDIESTIRKIKDAHSLFPVFLSVFFFKSCAEVLELTRSFLVNLSIESVMISNFWKISFNELKKSDTKASVKNFIEKSSACNTIRTD